LSKSEALPEHFSRWVAKEPSSDCWLWMGYLNRGYGQYHTPDARTVRAHRFSYEFLAGKIADKLTLDHLCNTKACVNPAHLSPVTRGENVQRYYSELPLCKKSKHEWTEENTVYHHGRRACRECKREYRAQYFRTKGA